MNGEAAPKISRFFGNIALLIVCGAMCGVSVGEIPKTFIHAVAVMYRKQQIVRVGNFPHGAVQNFRGVLLCHLSALSACAWCLHPPSLHGQAYRAAKVQTSIHATADAEVCSRSLSAKRAHLLPLNAGNAGCVVKAAFYVVL